MDTAFANSSTKAKLGIYVELNAKVGKEVELAQFLKSAQALVEAETGTLAWYALQLADHRFAIFDTFADDQGREAHLSGKVAEALMAHAPELLATQPVIQKIEILASK